MSQLHWFSVPMLAAPSGQSDYWSLFSTQVGPRHHGPEQAHNWSSGTRPQSSVMTLGHNLGCYCKPFHCKLKTLPGKIQKTSEHRDTAVLIFGRKTRLIDLVLSWKTTFYVQYWFSLYHYNIMHLHGSIK